ncbi:MAG: DNA ligase D [Candidatus Acidiferrales bacterium]
MGSLVEYKKKRKFERTPEPAGKEAARARGNSFVVQMHDATRLHWDLRLEIDGVLKSWAVPKGPSLNPADKRLAVMTEDHPLEYGGFEGVIPDGQYGAGPVMVWDNGTYKPLYDEPAGTQVANGEIKFALRGKKLRGSFVLVKIKSRRDDRGKSKNNEWLLIKHKDDAVDAQWDLEQHDRSVLTGRTIEEILEGMPASSEMLELDPAKLPGARKAPMPDSLEPMLAQLADNPFSDPQWLFEIKWDGWRTLAWIRKGKLELRARSGRTITAQYPDLSELPEHVDAEQAILDGEIVVLEPDGRSSFDRLQQRMNMSKPSEKQLRENPVMCYLFDLLYLDGYDLRDVPLLQRKRLLHQRLSPGGRFRYSDHMPEKGRELYDLAKAQGLEGILGKHIQSTYSGKRSSAWLKFKITQQLDAVVGGWTEPRGSRSHFGALLLGLYEGKALKFIGGVGTGFDGEKLASIFAKLKPLASEKCPFDVKPQYKEKCYWAEPKLVASLRYGEWTGEGHIRHPVFLRMRDDADPRHCIREAETPLHVDERPAVQAPAVVFAPKMAGNALTGEKAVGKELLSGRAENVLIELNGKRQRLSNLNKVYFPESRITKREVLAYYFQIAGRILPYLAERPMVLRRYPDGITGQPFFQKDAGESYPEWMEIAEVDSETERRTIRYFLCNEVSALLYLTNLGCIDHNPWPSRRDDLERPDYLFFDLDPTEGTDYAVTVDVGRKLMEKLDALGLEAFPKTSGADGLHLWLPLEREYNYEQTRTFSEIVARLVAAENPKLVTMERVVAKRPRGKVLIDSVQNAFGRPLASPWSVRAKPKAPLSVPLWPKELKRGLKPERFTLKTIFVRLKKEGDPWAKFWQRRQHLEAAFDALSRQM